MQAQSTHNSRKTYVSIFITHSVLILTYKEDMNVTSKCILQCIRVIVSIYVINKYTSLYNSVTSLLPTHHCASGSFRVRAHSGHMVSFPLPTVSFQLSRYRQKIPPLRTIPIFSKEGELLLYSAVRKIFLYLIKRLPNT